MRNACTINCNDLMKFVINLSPLFLQLKYIQLKTQKAEVIVCEIHVDRTHETCTVQEQFVFIIKIKENTLHVLGCMKGVKYP
jgi:hypothetical protein